MTNNEQGEGNIQTTQEQESKQTKFSLTNNTLLSVVLSMSVECIGSTVRMYEYHIKTEG